MKKITQNMTPRCIGRYLIDMPADLVLNSQFNVSIDDVKIEIRPMTQSAFEMQLEEYEKKLRRETMYGEPDVPYLRKIEAAPQVQLGKVFNRVDSPGGEGFVRILDLWAWRDGYLVKMEIKAYDTSDKKYQSEAWAKDFPTDLPEKLAHLLSMYERVRGRADNEVPTEQGVCIHNGFVLGPPSDEEEVLVSYHQKDSQDVYFSLETASNFREDTNLLDRGRQIEAGAAEADGHTVRKGRHEAHGIKYDEWLLTGKTTDRVKGQLFSFEANSKLGNAKAPIIMITFHNGYRIPAAPRTMEESAVLPDITQATLSEAESVALWDAVIPTLRPRPGAF
ncbi:T6SS immunity protein Tli4 family protein [Azonexus caeni]|uniref:T6SS immunity protein Tli4 family protein n=1 Tax=Azonexus caeni TaxID=266126 RepID=UPI003A8797B4